MALGFSSAFIILSLIPGIPLMLAVCILYGVLSKFSTFSQKKLGFSCSLLYILSFILITIALNHNVNHGVVDIFKIIIVSLPTYLAVLLVFIGISKLNRKEILQRENKGQAPFSH